MSQEEYTVIRKALAYALKGITDDAETFLLSALHRAKEVKNERLTKRMKKLHEEATRLGRHLADELTSVYEMEIDENDQHDKDNGL